MPQTYCQNSDTNLITIHLTLNLKLAQYIVETIPGHKFRRLRSTQKIKKNHNMAYQIIDIGVTLMSPKLIIITKPDSKWN
jgi:hypothetical protein